MTEERKPWREPEEVIERYTRPQPQEVVERYRRPLPPSMQPPAPKKRRSHKGLLVFLICMLLVAAGSAAAYFWPLLWGGYEEDYEYSYDQPEQPMGLEHWDGRDIRVVLQAEHDAVLTPQEIYARVNPAVVTISTWTKDSMGIGTGVLFHADGYLLTNYHVVEGGQECRAQLADGRTYDACFVTGSREHDIAVLKIGDDQPFPTAVLGDSDLLTVGDAAYAIGNPLGVELRGTFTNGMISAIDRDVRVDSLTMTLLQTTAALNSGNSGGPLINEYGEVVGINTIKMSSDYSTVEGLGFAVPTSIVRYIVNDLLEYGEILPEPVIGITVNQVGQPLPDGTVGILVQEVTPEGYGEAAGVQVGDYLVEADGTPTTSSTALLQARRRFSAGGDLVLRVWRDDHYFTAVVQFPRVER